MTPLPSTLDEETTSLIPSAQRRQKDMSDFQIPRADALATQRQLAAELREDLDVFARQVELRTRRCSLASLRKDARTALLTSKRAIDAKQLSKREELLRSSVLREKRTLNEKVTEDALMKANNDVTETLQRTIGLMQGELERSVLSTQLLDSSTAALRSTSSTHDVLGGLMVTSKHLITALERSDWLDRLVIVAGLAFFVLVVLFILKQRIVDRGVRIAFWWMRFIPEFSGDEALTEHCDLI
ncbi:hypothetical protein A0H81_12415 [Grifola frondosa]|uniref:Sec20 C-terminal domain-containing protein n=1 Tax=Grifola frondosa TaxID=5627 RepID=A0A1C7LUW5_GRIFR|nr:hypothetical protein A0H81_12415 [Grifola frondosa]